MDEAICSAIMVYSYHATAAKSSPSSALTSSCLTSSRQTLVFQEVRYSSDIGDEGLKLLPLSFIGLLVLPLHILGYQQKSLNIRTPCNELFIHTFAVFLYYHTATSSRLKNIPQFLITQKVKISGKVAQVNFKAH